MPKHARRVEGFDEAIISLYAKGLTTGEVAAHLGEVYGTSVSRELVSKVTDKIVDELTSWQSQPLDRVYPVVFVDALHVEIRSPTTFWAGPRNGALPGHVATARTFAS